MCSCRRPRSRKRRKLTEPNRNDQPFFHRAAAVRLRDLDRDHAGRTDFDLHAAGRAVPEHHAVADFSDHHLSGRRRQNRAGDGNPADRSAAQRREADALHQQHRHRHRHGHDQRDLRHRHRRRPEHREHPEPGQLGQRPDARGGAPPERDRKGEIQQYAAGDRALFPQRDL